MADRAIVNASPLIFLARTDHFDVLRLLAPDIIVPEPVASELRKRGPSDPAVDALRQANWITIVTAPDIPPAIEACNLGPGESSVLALAYLRPWSEAILDDGSGRRCAATLGIPLRGTVGVILLGRQRGIVPQARPIIEQLRLIGMYLSDRVMNEALALVGE